MNSHHHHQHHNSGGVDADDDAPPRLTLEETAVDACSRKRHAVSRGYFSDPYLKFFARDSTYLNNPLMNRGYWLRVRAVESAINKFVAALPNPTDKFQIVSLGGGYDTLFFRWAGLATGADDELAASANSPTDSEASQYESREYALSAQSTAGQALCQGRLARFVEIDQAEVVVGKARVVRQHAELAALASLQAGAPITEPLVKVGDPSKADVFRLVAGDLRHGEDVASALVAATPPSGGGNAHEVPVFESRQTSALLDAALPTLVIAECVLVYMRPNESYGLLDALVKTFASSPSFAVLSYDAIRPNTPFGKQMIHALGERGLELRGIHDLPDTAAHEKRYASLGFHAIKSWTMRALSDSVPEPVRLRLQHIEMLDDYDEWCMMHEQYSMSWAWKRAGEAPEPEQKASHIPRLFA